MTTNRKPNRPSHTLFIVADDKEDTIWTEIGALWTHSKGNGFNLTLNRELRLVILPRKAKEEQPKEEAGQ